MKAVVYGLIDKATKELRYIGKTCSKLEKRLYNHIWEAENSNYKTHKINWLNQLIENGDVPEIMVLEEYPSEETAYKAEQELIEYYKSIGCKLVNTLNGGQGPIGFSPSEETREKKRQAMKALNFGGENNPFYGRHHTEETKALLSEIGKSKPIYKRTQAHLDRMSKIHKGKKISEEQKAQLREANLHKMKPVKLLETGEVFESVVAASKATGCDKGNIAKCCNGKARSSMGLHFEYVKAE